jgi:hypothetical protein
MEHRVSAIPTYVVKCGIVLALAACHSVADHGTDASADAAVLGWGSDVRLTNDPGSSMTTYNFAHDVAVGAGNAVHVVWYDDRDGTAQVYYKRSLDNGATWDADRRLIADASATRLNPAVAASGDTVYASWHEVRADGGYYVAVARSLDRGTTWDPPITLTSTKASAFTSIAADGTAAQIVWGDNATGVTEIWQCSSHDSGQSWTTPIQISSSPYDSWVPNVALQGDRVITSWVDYKDANEEEYQRVSNDGGSNWSAIARRTNQPADSWAPSVAIAGDVVHLFWFDRRDSAYSDVDVEQPLDDAAALIGITVEPIPPRDPAVYYLDDFTNRLGRKVSAIMTAAPAWVMGGGSLAQLQGLLQQYQDRFVTWETSWEIYYARSSDGGVTFGPDTRMTTAPGLSQRPSVVAIGDLVDVVWFDGRDNTSDASDTEIYYKGSTDGGLTWSDDLRLTTTPGTSTLASIAATADRVHVVWYDARDGNNEIYYKQLAR